MKKTIFIDCFNTVLLRKKSDSEVLQEWSEILSQKYQQLSKEQFYSLFRASQQCLHKVRLETIEEAEYTLEELLLEMKKRINAYDLISDFNGEDFLKFAKKSYITTEQKNLYTNSGIIKYLLTSKKQGKRIYLVSNFYCSKTIINIWFEHLGIAHLFDELYISCDYNKSKRTGRLYDYIISTQNLNKSDILMIGDSKDCDYIIPKKMGIATKLVKSKKYKKSKPFKYYWVKIPKTFLKIYKKNNNYNYSNYAFPLYLFTKKLVDKLTMCGAKHIFFCSREGQFLKFLFDEYVATYHINIKSHYLEVSRNSVFIAALKPLTDEKFESLLIGLNKHSVYSFLKSLDFANDEIIILQKHTKLDIYKNIQNFEASYELNILKGDKLFVKMYDEKRLKNRNAFNQYLQSFQVDFNTEGMHIVDVGWRGTIQDNIYKFLKNVNITGYYIGYNGEGILNKHCIKFGLLWNNCPFVANYTQKVFNFRMLNFEHVLKANHNRVIGYTINHNQKPVVIYDTVIDETKFFNTVVLPVQSEIKDKFKMILSCEKIQQSTNLENIIAQLYARTIIHATYKDFSYLYTCLRNHFDSFGRIGKSCYNGSKIQQFFRYKLSNYKFVLKLFINKL